jgi:hypothetical protein
MRYFLLGTYGIDMFNKNDYKSLAQNKNKWELVGYSSHRHDITELLEQVIGWECYLELSENEVKLVNDAIEVIDKQNRDFYKEFYANRKKQISDEFQREHTGF